MHVPSLGHRTSLLHAFYRYTCVCLCMYVCVLCVCVCVCVCVTGAVIQLGEASGHALIIESLESMENPQHYLWAYGFGLLYVL